MAFVPYTLPKATTLFRHSPTGELSLRLEAGENVRHERVETDTEIVDTVKVVRDGFTWTRVQRKPKQGGYSTVSAVGKHPSGAGSYVLTQANEDQRAEENVAAVVAQAAKNPVVTNLAGKTFPVSVNGEGKVWDGNRWLAPDHPDAIRLLNPSSAPPVSKSLDDVLGPIPTNGNGHAPSPPVVPAPTVSQQIDNAAKKTAQSVGAAVNVIAARETKYVDSEEKKVRQLDRAANMLRGDVFQVNYYIPTCLDVPNPSVIFRKHGFRLDGSNWVFPAHGLEARQVQQVLKNWDEMDDVETESTIPGFTSKVRVRYWVIKYTSDQLEKMRDLAMSQLAEELQKTHRSLIERIDNAARTLQDAQDALDDSATAQDRDKLENTYYGSLRATVKEACERFEMCLKGAEIFDETGNLDSLFCAVRDAIRTRALAINALLQNEGRKGVPIPQTISNPTINPWQTQR